MPAPTCEPRTYGRAVARRLLVGREAVARGAPTPDARVDRAAAPAERDQVLPRHLAPLALLLTATACASLLPLTTEESARLDAFDFVWQELADEYPMFGHQPVDWDELRTRYRAAVPFAREPHEFQHLVAGMLSELGDLHVSYEAPRERFAPPGVAATSLLDAPGFAVMPIEGRLHVVGWPAGQSPLAPDGVPVGSACPEIWRVNGFPVVLSLVGNLLLGPAGSTVELQLRWRDGAITRHAMRRPDAGASRPAPLFAHLDPKSRAPRAATVADAAWIELRTFVDAGEVDAAEKALAQPAAQRGVVLDLRRNQGGQILLAQRLVERFLPTPIDLVFVPKEPVTTWFGLFDVELFVVDEWRPQPPTLQAPLVVLTSALTGSSAEHAARVLQRHCGAIVVGERTAGAEAVVRSSVAPDGSVLRFGSTRVVDRTGVGLQREGVAPDVAVRLTVADVEAHGPERAVAEWEERLAEAAAAALARRRGR